MQSFKFPRSLFSNVALETGENLFEATAADPSENISPPSEQISVTLDSTGIPDLEVTTDDIFIYPPSPIAGEEATVTAVVRNKGQTEVKDVGIDVYLWDTKGSLTLMKTEKVAYMLPQSEESITIRLDTSGKTGTNEIIVVIDPEDKIRELLETNNEAVRQFFIAEREGISLTTTLDAGEYGSGQDVNIHVRLRNSGIGKDVLLEIWIEDQNGSPVILLDQIETNLPYASEKNYNLRWNTGSTYAGLYRVRSVLRGSPEVLAENTVSFTILPDIQIDSTVTTDKSRYRPNENVTINMIVKNNGRNQIFPELKVGLRIVGIQAQEVFNEEKGIGSLLPGSSASLNSNWNTGFNPPGDYRAVADIYLDGKVISNKSALFRIDPSVILTGKITVTPSVVFLGGAAQADYTIKNTGNGDAMGLIVKVSVVEPETWAVIDSHEESLDLPMQSTHAGGWSFFTEGYGLKTYTLNLEYLYQATQKSIGITSLTVKDGTPPEVVILSPTPDSYFNSTSNMTALATDNASGIDKVEYQVDSGSWEPLPVSDPSLGRYSMRWTPTPSDEGRRTISFRATDRSGNKSVPVATNFTIDLTPPGPPQISSPPDQALLLSEFIDIRGIADPGSTVEMSSLNPSTTQANPGTGEFSFSGVKLNPGRNSFAFRASDLAGNVGQYREHTINLVILEGSLSAQPNPVFQGNDVTITSTVTNKVSVDIAGLSLEILIIDAGTGAVVNRFGDSVSIPMTGMITRNFTLSTSTLNPQVYRAILQVSSATITPPRTLSSTTFEVKRTVETVFCQLQSVKDVLDPVSGLFPGNEGPDVIAKAHLTESVQAAIDAAGDFNGDGYIIVGVVSEEDGLWGGHVNQRIVIGRDYALPFALIGCSVTLHDPTPADDQPTAWILPDAGSPENIFVMGLHGASSGVAGWLVEGDGRYLRNVDATGNTVGIWFAGDGNTMHNGSAEGNGDVGILVEGNDNLITDADAMANGGDGIQVFGNNNELVRNDVGDKNKGNSGDGINVTGSGNMLNENNAYANRGDGIHISGSMSSNPNVLKKNRSGDRGKGNLGNGIWIGGSGNGKPDPVEIEQNTTKTNGRNGIQVIGTGWELKNNVSGGTTGEDNGDCEFAVATANFNATGNRSNGVAIAGKDGTSFPTGCVGTP